MAYHKGRTLTKDFCRSVASQYVVRQHLLDNDSSVYRKCKTEGWLDEFLPRSRRKNFTKEECRVIAAKYSSRRELELSDTPVYLKCVREGWIQEFYGDKQHRSLDEDFCREVAKKYKYRVDLKRADISVYTWLLQNKLLDELFPKYKKVKSRDDAVYLIETNIKVGNLTAYKVGVTSSNLLNRRPLEVIDASGIQSKVKCLVSVSVSARSLEKLFLGKGVPVTFFTPFTGSTEYRLFSEEEVIDIMKTLNENATGVV